MERQSFSSKRKGKQDVEKLDPNNVDSLYFNVKKILNKLLHSFD